jgi:hypothetical protein
MEPLLLELVALAGIAALGCGLESAVGDLLLAAIFGAASGVAASISGLASEPLRPFAQFHTRSFASRWRSVL